MQDGDAHSQISLHCGSGCERHSATTAHHAGFHAPSVLTPEQLAAIGLLLWPLQRKSHLLVSHLHREMCQLAISTHMNPSKQRTNGPSMARD